jgi:hypothetical protein
MAHLNGCVTIRLQGMVAPQVNFALKAARSAIYSMVSSDDDKFAFEDITLGRYPRLIPC